jgi:hypothetical protein
MAEQEDEYESALTFLCAFRSQRADAINDLRRMAPLYTIIESDAEGSGSFIEDELSDEFSLALSDDTVSSPRLKKTIKSNCLLDFADAIYGGSSSSASSSSCSSADSDLLLYAHDYNHYFDLCRGYDHSIGKLMKLI